MWTWQNLSLWKSDIWFSDPLWTIYFTQWWMRLMLAKCTIVSQIFCSSSWHGNDGRRRCFFSLSLCSTHFSLSLCRYYVLCVYLSVGKGSQRIWKLGYFDPNELEGYVCKTITETSWIERNWVLGSFDPHDPHGNIEIKF